MTRDVTAILAAKTVRTFSYGFLGIVLPLHLSDLGLGPAGVGGAVTLMLLGSAVLTWAVRRPAERYGARATLVGLAGLSVIAALLLLATRESGPARRVHSSPWNRSWWHGRSARSGARGS